VRRLSSVTCRCRLPHSPSAQVKVASNTTSSGADNSSPSKTFSRHVEPTSCTLDNFSTAVEISYIYTASYLPASQTRRKDVLAPKWYRHYLQTSWISGIPDMMFPNPGLHTSSRHTEQPSLTLAPNQLLHSKDICNKKELHTI
jgi:hypothetical protein